MMSVVIESKTCASLHALTGVLVVAYAVGTFLVGPSIFSDPGWGFLVADSMAQGGPFNHLVEPDLDNIARNASRFLAAWSPAQYVLPTLIERLGLDLGHSIAVVTSVFSALGLIGWHRLYRAWGFPPLSSAIALLIIAGGRMFSLPFGIFSGGEILVFGGLPWFTLLLWRWRALAAWQALGILLAMAALVFLKLSGLVFALSALAAIVVSDLWPPRAARLRRPAMALAIAVVFCIAFHEFWISGEWTPVVDIGEFYPERLLTHSAGGIAAAVMGTLSLGDLTARLLRYPGYPMLASLDWVYVAASVPALALLIFTARRLRASHADYLRFVLPTSAIFIVLLTIIFARGGALDLEDRHFRPLALILLIGVVHAVATTGGRLRMAFAGVAATSIAYGMASFVVHLGHNFHRPLSDRGFRHAILSQPALDFLRSGGLERSGSRADSVVYVTSPEIGLEVRNARIICAHADFEDDAVLRDRIYAGRVERLTVLVQTKLIGEGKADLILASFVDYDRSKWIAHSLGDFTYFTQ